MRKELLTYKDPKSPVSEIFRTLRTNIQFMNTNGKLKTLLVTSTFPEEGKSWITANLAVTFAQAGKRVMLIDADMRKGRQYTIFGAMPKPGLSNYLSNMDANNNETEDAKITNYIQETDVDNLHLLTAGNVPPNPSELLVSRRMRSLLNELKEMCDLVIIDGTPCDLVTDAIILSRIVDATVIVTAQKQTKKDNLNRIVKNIQNVGGKIAGVVVNKVDMSAKKYNQAYYYGSISANNTSKKSSKKQLKNIDDLFAGFQKKEKELEIPEFEEDFEEARYAEPEYSVKDEETVENYMAAEEPENYKPEVKRYEEPKYEAPKYEKIQYEEPKHEETKHEIPQYEVPQYERTKHETPQYEVPKHETPRYEVPKYEEFKYEQQEYNKPKTKNYTNFNEIEAKIEAEGKISEIKIDQNMDEKTKDILRQVNEYIESEKRRQGEKY